MKVTCKACGEEVEVSKTTASQILSKGRKAQKPDDLREWGAKGAEKRWQGHIKKTVKSKK